MIPTSASGSLWYNTQRIGRCTNVNINIARSTFRTTKQGDVDETFIKGLRSATGTATLFYDPEDSAAISLLREMQDDNIAKQVEIKLVLDETGIRYTQYPIIITQVGVSVAYGEAQTCQIEFQATGRMVGGF